MLAKDISFIIPVYNRPDEINDLLSSFVNLKGNKDFEILIIEDGSDINCSDIINLFRDKLNISYFFKENTGPGDSRNYGMKMAKGKYFIILDSDCILPENYLNRLINNLNDNFSECFGGVDDSHKTFNSFQKAVSFSMTSLITTGHIRGGKYSKKFQPRSFNMGISKKAFEMSNGFGKIHPGEDPDLSIRLNKLGIKTHLYSDVKVFHKRRISAYTFFKQVYKFGVARIILNNWHTDTKRIAYWFPSFFSVFTTISILLHLFKIDSLCLILFFIYMTIVFIYSSVKNNIFIGFISIITTLIQFFGYGYGFLKSFILVKLNKNKKMEDIFPKMFFK